MPNGTHAVDIVVNCVFYQCQMALLIYIPWGMFYFSAQKRVLGKVKGKELMRGSRRVGWVKMANGQDCNQLQVATGKRDR